MNKINFLFKYILFIALHLCSFEEIKAQAGALDSTFDADGKVVTYIGLDCFASCMALQNNGKILVAGGSAPISLNDFAIVRYNSDGSLDLSFDMDGVVTTDIDSSNDYVNAIGVQQDGKIVVAGHHANGLNHNLGVVRYNSNGSLDTTFDHDGKVVTDIGNFSYAQALAIQADGKILVAGNAYDSLTLTDFLLVRYNSNGSLDSTFDFDGKVTTDVDGAIEDYAYSIVIQPDGKIILGGNSSNIGISTYSLVRYLQNGSLDSTFDGDGKLTTAIGSTSDGISSMALQADGKIIAAGSSANGSNVEFSLARYNLNGSLDTSFDSDGMVTTAFDLNSDDYGRSVKIQPDGKILVAGTQIIGVGSFFAIAKYNQNGSLDTSFSTDGLVRTSFAGPFDQGYAMELQNDTKIVVAGVKYNGTTQAFAVARYNNPKVTGIVEVSDKEAKFEIFPNPFKGLSNIQFKSSFKKATLNIINVHGDRVKSISIGSVQAGQIMNLFCEGFSDGIYFIELLENNQRVSRKMIEIID